MDSLTQGLLGVDAENAENVRADVATASPAGSTDFAEPRFPVNPWTQTWPDDAGEPDRPFDFDIPTETPPLRGFLSDPERATLRVYMLVADLGPLVSEFVDVLDCWTGKDDEGERRDADWREHTTISLRGIPWLARTICGYIDPEMFPPAISTANERLNLIEHPILTSTCYEVADGMTADVDPDADEFGIEMDAYFAEVVTACEHVADALDGFVSRFEDFKPCDSRGDDPNRYAARQVDDFRGASWAIRNAIGTLYGELMPDVLDAARGRLRKRLERCPWLARMESESADAVGAEGGVH